MGHRPDKSRRYYWLTEVLFQRHLVQVRLNDVRIDHQVLN